MKNFILSFLISFCFISIAYGQNTTRQVVTNDDSIGSNVATPTAASYIIGPEDLITIFVWKEPDLTETIAVRPDGKISMPLLNDLNASGFTALELKDTISKGLKQYIEEPTVTVIVQAARSQKASIMGEVNHPSTYFINGPTTLIQLIALAGGFRDFAATDKIMVIRQENGQTVKLKFNYREFTKGKNLGQNIPILAGDIVVVP